MAKSQLRSNREVKKPKQPQKPVVPTTPFGGTSSSAGLHTPEVKKK
ncbi:MAG: hypothetical protein JNJ81_04420 [Candidatus Accumulibacter sp.]|nr:hypothetical protein [Accumulibacter sp.]